MTRCGFVTLVGRPNTGKSTLLNKIVGHKVSITSRRPQTTRHRIVGVKNCDDAQVVFIDTPGLHQPGKSHINRLMNRAASSSLAGVDVVVLLIQPPGWTQEDEYALKRLRDIDCPVILAINKIDQLKEKKKLLPLLQKSADLYDFEEIVPISALRGEGVDRLEGALLKLLPEQPFIYPSDQVTDRGDYFFAAEIVREQIFNRYSAEVPYSTTVTIAQIKKEGKLINVNAVIWVEKEGQKKIIIGRGGERIKAVGEGARKQLEKEWGCKVFLELWVRVRDGWTDDSSLLEHFGYPKV